LLKVGVNVIEESEEIILVNFKNLSCPNNDKGDIKKNKINELAITRFLDLIKKYLVVYIS
jgi:hypothetical protein